MGLITAIRGQFVRIELTIAQVREEKGELPPRESPHGRAYYPLKFAYRAFSDQWRQPRSALAHLESVEGWDLVDHACQATAGPGADLAPGQLRSLLTGIIAQRDYHSAGAINDAALAVLRAYYKSS